MPTLYSVYVGARDLNSGPHALCTNQFYEPSISPALPLCVCVVHMHMCAHVWKCKCVYIYHVSCFTTLHFSPLRQGLPGPDVSKEQTTRIQSLHLLVLGLGACVTIASFLFPGVWSQTQLSQQEFLPTERSLQLPYISFFNDLIYYFHSYISNLKLSCHRSQSSGS